MNINTYHLIEGARKAKGIAVIIDVFRAFSVECYLAQNNAKRIIPVGSVYEARRLKKENPDYILLGEREGVTIEGFSYGNSPSQIENVDFTGKTVVHTTGAGTQGLENAINADEILTGSLVNAKAIADYIKTKNPAEVSLVAMGWQTRHSVPEDDLCAEYITSLLEGRQIDMPLEIEKIRKHPEGAKFFDPSKPEFPESDFALCVDYDKFNFVMRVTRDSDGLLRSEKVNFFPCNSIKQLKSLSLTPP